MFSEGRCESFYPPVLLIHGCLFNFSTSHYNDVIMSEMASQITSFTIVYSTVYSGVDQRKHQSSASLPFCKGNSRVTGEFPPQWASNVKKISVWWRHRVIACSISAPLNWVSIPENSFNEGDLVFDDYNRLTVEECKRKCEKTSAHCLAVVYQKDNSSCMLKSMSPLDTPLIVDANRDVYMHCVRRLTNGK